MRMLASLSKVDETKRRQSCTRTKLTLCSYATLHMSGSHAARLLTISSSSSTRKDWSVTQERLASFASSLSIVAISASLARRSS